MRVFDEVVNAWRAIARRPLFSLGVMTMLAVGLGFNTALYAVVESALIRPLPYREPSRLAFIWYGLPTDGPGYPNSYADFEEIRGRSQAFAAMTTFKMAFMQTPNNSVSRTRTSWEGTLASKVCQ